MGAVDGSWSMRCTSVLDELVAARVRRNASATALSGETAPVLEYVPSQRDVREALKQRFGSSPSFRDIGPLLTDYLTRNTVYDKLPVNPRGRTRAEPIDTALPVPQRVLAAIDQNLSNLDTSRRKLAAIFAQVAADENSIQQRRVRQLELQLAQAEAALANNSEMVDIADSAEEQNSALRTKLDSVEEARDDALTLSKKAQAELANALHMTDGLIDERDRLQRECARLSDIAAIVDAALAARLAAERGRDDAVTALAKLSGNEQALEELRSAVAARRGSASGAAATAGTEASVRS